MKLAVAFLAMVLAGCSTTGASVNPDGTFSGMKSHDAANAVKATKRAEEVESFTSNRQSIFKMEAIEGQTISISGVKSIEVNVPLDPRDVLSRQIESQSEAVQMVREIRGAARDVVLPLVALDRAADLAGEQIRATRDERIANTQAMGELSELATDAASKNPIVVTVPEGGSAQVLSLD